MKPTRAGFGIPWVISCLPTLPALRLISLSLLDSLEKHEPSCSNPTVWEKKKAPVSTPSRYPHHPRKPPTRINKSALWTSVSVCIMDDVADGP